MALLLAACGPGGGGPVACTLGGAIDSALTFDPAVCSPYHATDGLIIEGAGRLVVKPGTTLAFAQDTGLYVQGHGALVAVGTASDKILFTGASQLRGYWNGIVSSKTPTASITNSSTPRSHTPGPISARAVRATPTTKRRSTCRRGHG